MRRLESESAVHDASWHLSGLRSTCIQAEEGSHMVSSNLQRRQWVNVILAVIAALALSPLATNPETGTARSYPADQIAPR